jgi:hypothetical protein
MDTILSTRADMGMPLPQDGITGVSPSAVSSTAIIAGALVAAAVTLVLVALGAGFGFAALSPWPHVGVSAPTFAVTTAIGLIIVQWISSALGGYITGRLRTKWISVHTHEVFFRDTAHGLIMWATATLIVTAAVAVIAMSTAGNATRAAGAIGAATSTSAPSVDAYDIDTLLRPASVQTAPASAEVRAQTTRIVAQSLVSGSVGAEDQSYLTQLISVQAGVPQAEAQTRVNALNAKIRQSEDAARAAADSARRVAEKTSLFTGFAMMIGAFIACVSAAIGGRLRDLHP